jgi:tetratricopeptide (TPR) repeat protein
LWHPDAFEGDPTEFGRHQMSFADWPEEEVAKVQEGLLLLGWRADDRLTSDDAHLIADVAHKALDLKKAGALTPDAVDRLAVEAHKFLWSQIMNPSERMFTASATYTESKFLAKLLSLLDEATLCYYRGYYTAALSILFIVLESYLRDLMGWVPGDPDPKFWQLKEAVRNHRPSLSRNEAEQIVSVVFARYDPTSPPQFLFNRHGLLHGVRGPDDVDEMNCARMFLLFDILCDAEGIGRVLVHSEDSWLRGKVYSDCGELESEQKLLKEVNRLEKIVSDNRVELEALSREHNEQRWARAQRALGDALSVLGERDKDARRLFEAIAAYEAALEEQTREAVPLEWATTTAALGTTLFTLGKREYDDEILQRAITEYSSALEVLDCNDDAMECAKVQNNLAHALETLGQLNSDPLLFKKAARAWEIALSLGTGNWSDKMIGYIRSRIAKIRPRSDGNPDVG